MTTTTERNHAAEYADDIAARIHADADDGHPFGIASDDYPAADREIGDELTAYDWLSDVLDIQYLVDGDRTYRSARVLIAFGGPNAWIDTRTGQLEVSWGALTEIRNLPFAFIDGLDAELEVSWGMGA